MNGPIEYFNGVSAAWFDAMQLVSLHSIVVLVVASCAARILRKAGPAVTFWIWIAAAGKLIILLAFPWIVAVPILSNSPKEPVLSNDYIVSFDNSSTADGRTETVTHNSARYFSWQSCLFSIWSILIAFQFVVIVRRRRELARTLSLCRQTDESELAAVDELRKKADVSLPVNICRGDVAVPFVAGTWTSTIVLPADLPSVQNDEDSRRIVLHELAHIRRRDLVWIWVPEIARIIFFFNPVAYRIRAEAALAREAACDQFVIRAGTSASEYANMLLTLSARAPLQQSHASDTTELLGFSSH